MMNPAQVVRIVSQILQSQIHLITLAGKAIIDDYPCTRTASLANPASLAQALLSP